ncbi:mycofactocin biosynthesis chaperone MftB [Nocardia stercoris]|uniref:Mycofactocin biosynthesis chaperone MftB n=1 Tax=Nocardia stercoris TaxID=2483361 RepID=A0A3M2KWK1_9NOCA|nr:mycofactocin biosynthesis chaperone MftB [Nocardia stercoris]RMI28830.1 mycofactocin biosynthesis chaperone MftB [Nocardia stercoris]
MSTDPATFDPARPYALAESVSLRPETFGALAYDYRTRRLSFLKTPGLVGVVEALECVPDVFAALAAAAIPDAEHDDYLRALAGLHESGTIRCRITRTGHP